MVTTGFEDEVTTALVLTCVIAALIAIAVGVRHYLLKSSTYWEEEAILEVLDKHGALTLAELRIFTAEYSSPATIEQKINEMVAKGRVSKYEYPEDEEMLGGCGFGSSSGARYRITYAGQKHWEEVRPLYLRYNAPVR